MPSLEASPRTELTVNSTRLVNAPAGSAAVIVADVAGHGASAAIVMAMIRTALHTYGGALDDPEEVLRHLNDHFDYLREKSLFSTAIYAVLDPRAGRVRLARAGHPEPLLLRNGSGAVALEIPGTIRLLDVFDPDGNRLQLSEDL